MLENRESNFCPFIWEWIRLRSEKGVIRESFCPETLSRLRGICILEEEFYSNRASTPKIPNWRGKMSQSKEQSWMERQIDTKSIRRSNKSSWLKSTKSRCLPISVGNWNSLRFQIKGEDESVRKFGYSLVVDLAGAWKHSIGLSSCRGC